MIRFIGFLLLFGLIQTDLSAQVSKTSSEKFSYFLADVSYSSDAVFMGRRDSIEAPYIFPSIGYYDRSGFFANASASYLLRSSEERMDLFLLSAGYLYSKGQFYAGLSGTKYFFNEDSYNVQSEVEADLTAMLNYDFKAAEVGLSGSAYFGSSNTDLSLNLMLDRTFYALDKKLLITPTVELGAGTQYFYQAYYNSSRMGNRKGNGPGGMSMQNMEVQLKEASEFNFLNIELSLPVSYFYKHLIFSFTPALAFPQSPASISTASGTIEEDLDSVFYWSAGVSYWIKTGN